MEKVYISVDLEGLNGVVYDHQTNKSGGIAYDQVCKELHTELKLITETLTANGVKYITINDAHTKMDNLILEGLPDNVELISGKPKPVSMVHGLDSSYSALFLIGYHSPAGSDRGVLAHTFNHSFKTVKLNNQIVSEAQLNALYAGLNNVPVALATGDDFFCKYIENTFNNIQIVTTKYAISFNSARMRPKKEYYNDLKESIVKAINAPEKWFLYKLTAPYKIEIEFKEKINAETCCYLPCVSVDNSTVTFESMNYEEVYKFLQFMSAVF